MRAEDYYKRIAEKWKTEYPSSTSMDDVWEFYRECGYENPKRTLGDILNRVKWVNRRVLDFGCDNGIILHFICTKYPEVSGVGIDINPAAVKKAQQVYPTYEFQLFDGLQTSFEGKSFDLVFVSAVIKHIRYEDRDRVYGELNRIADSVFFIETDSKVKKEEAHRFWTFYHSNFEEEFGQYFEPIKVIHEAGDILGLYACK